MGEQDGHRGYIGCVVVLSNGGRAQEQAGGVYTRIQEVRSLRIGTKKYLNYFDIYWKISERGTVTSGCLDVVDLFFGRDQGSILDAKVTFH